MKLKLLDLMVLISLFLTGILCGALLSQSALEKKRDTQRLLYRGDKTLSYVIERGGYP